MNKEQLKYYGMVPLNEMAYERGDLKDKWRADFEQITINWCLVYIAQNNQKYQRLENHWKSELSGHLKSANKKRIKKANSMSSRIKLLRDSLLYDGMDLNRHDVINSTISEKFIKEKIKTSGKLYRNCISSFSQEIPNLIVLIATGDTKEIEKYVEDLYLTENE